jgi:hypothetical protein
LRRRQRPTPAGAVDAKTLTRDFDNEVCGSQLYSGKVFDIQGALEYVSRGEGGSGPSLALVGAKYVDVRCALDESGLSAAAAVEPKSTVTIRGLVTGKSDGRFVYVEPCEVAPRAAHRDSGDPARRSRSAK